jgi:hypothetical protein
LSLKPPGFDKAVIWNKSAVNVILAFTIGAAIAQIMSFVVAEKQARRHDKLFGDIYMTSSERLIF